ncbi:MAG: response regulator [Vulcanimicrobiota bacterium]
MRVLLVEDNPADAMLLQDELETSMADKVSVTLASSLAEASQLLEAQEFDAVLLDMGLPDGRGPDSIFRVRSFESDIPVVVLTGLDDREMASRALQAEAEDYLIKGVDSGRVIARALRHAIERHASRATIKKALRVSADGVGVISLEGKVLYSNEVAEQLMGWKPGLQVELDPEAEEWVSPGQLILESRVVELDWEGVPARLFSLRDITARKAAEENLREAQAQLLQTQKMDAIGRLAGGVAHDFNNLLMGILAHADILLRGVATDPQTTRASLESIVNAAEKASHLTRQLLGFARREVRERVPLDLNASVRESLELVRPTLGKDVHTRCSFEASPAVLLGDSTQLCQILVNLAVNARDAMPDGGTLTFHTSLEGSQLVLRVEDTGAGMEPEVKERIFEPFFTTKARGEGTGMGLPMVYALVESHEGQMTVESAPGKGTTFEVRFPALKSVPAETPPANLNRDSRRALVVDDMQVVRETATQLLVYLGYRVDSVASAEEARSYLEREGGEIDVIILDLVMPGVSGLEVLPILRQLAPSARIILSTGYRRALDGGDLEQADGVMMKPYTISTLEQTLKDIGL